MFVKQDSAKSVFRNVDNVDVSLNIFVQELISYCSQVGEIVDIRLIKTYKGLSKGYAFVQFKDEVRAHLHPATATSLRHCYQIQSIVLVLYCYTERL